MEKRSASEGSQSNEVRAFKRPRRVTAEDIALGRKPLGPVEAQAAAGMKRGAYVVQCDGCDGKGYTYNASGLMENCTKCWGEGAVIVRELRPSQFGWKLAAFLMLVGLFILFWIFMLNR